MDKVHFDLPLYCEPIKADDTFRFTCTGCADCCRNVALSVYLDSIDAFRLARYFKDRGRPCDTVEKVLDEYTTMMSMDQVLYPIFPVKTTGADNACVFLAKGRCGIYEARPIPCRLYPMSAGYGDSALNYIICKEKPHHFKGGKVRAGDWMKEYFTHDVQDYLVYESELAKDLGQLLHRVPEQHLQGAFFHILTFKFFSLDVNQPFMPQYMELTGQLKTALQEMGDRS